MAVASTIGAKHYLECSARTGESVRCSSTRLSTPGLNTARRKVASCCKAIPAAQREGRRERIEVARVPAAPPVIPSCPKVDSVVFGEFSVSDVLLFYYPHRPPIQLVLSWCTLQFPMATNFAHTILRSDPFFLICFDGPSFSAPFCVCYT